MKLKLKTVTLFLFRFRFRKRKGNTNTNRRYRDWYEQRARNPLLEEMASMSIEEVLEVSRRTSSRYRIHVNQLLRKEMKKRPLNVEQIRRLFDWRQIADLYLSHHDLNVTVLRLLDKNAKLDKPLCYMIKKVGEMMPPNQRFIIFQESLAMYNSLRG